jgi:hypothetical protein
MSHQKLTAKFPTARRAMWLVWRPRGGRPEFLCVCTSAKAARKAIAKVGTAGRTVTVVPS